MIVEIVSLYQSEIWLVQEEGCMYCYRAKHGKWPVWVSPVTCSVHMAVLERKYKNILYSRKDENK